MILIKHKKDNTSFHFMREKMMKKNLTETKNKVLIEVYLKATIVKPRLVRK
jgi:hypothetical protein